MGDDIYFMCDYNWERGEILSEGKKNFKVLCNWGNGKKAVYIPKEKCAYPTEEVCVVWETWKGKNGRGGYRVERELYPTDRVPATQVHYQHIGGPGRVTETTYGVKR
jgi:hypothetical protein